MGPETLAIASLVATGVSAVGSIAQGNAAAKVGEYNARVAERDAVIAGQERDYALARQKERTGRVLAAQRAAIGASGTTAEGSPLLVMADTAAQLQLDALSIQRAGDINAIRRTEQAAIDRAQAAASRSAGYAKAGASLLSGVSQNPLFKAGA